VTSLTRARVLRHPGRSAEIGQPPTGNRRPDVVEADLLHSASSGHGTDDPVSPRPGGHEGSLLDRQGHHQSAGVVGVLSDQVDSPGGGPDANGLLAERGDEQVGHLICRCHSGFASIDARSICAASSGQMSLIHTPAADSEPARYLSFSAALRSEKTSRNSRLSVSSALTGA
jgi:hypothetical protein